MQYQSNVQKHTQTHTLKILPQQIQLLNLLNLNTLELESYIQKQLEENPFLERNEDVEFLDALVEMETHSEAPAPSDEPFDKPIAFRGLDDEIPDYRSKTENGYDSDEPYQTPAVQYTDIREDLKTQCNFLSNDARMRTLCAYLIDSLDDSGFLGIELDTLADDISFSQNRFFREDELREALRLVQQLDPPGIGARNLRECLLIQLQHHKAQGFKVDLPIRLVQDYMEALAAHEYAVIKNALHVEEEDLCYALEYIRALNPRPLRGLSDPTVANTDTIIPEYVVEIDGSDRFVTLANGRAETLKLGEGMEEMLKSTRDKKAEQFIRKKMEDANWIIGALRERDDSMLRVMRVLAVLQRDFFLSGDPKKIKPMVLRDVAAYVHLDTSTVSRLTSSKYAQTPFGIVHVKDLFLHTFTAQDGREINNEDVQDCLGEIVAAECKTNPLNDTALCKLLAERGYPVARRTVAKYREQLNIPIAALRRTV